MTLTFLASQTYNDSNHLRSIAQELQRSARRPCGLVANFDVRDHARVVALAAGRTPLDPLLVDPGVVRFDRPTIGPGQAAAAPWVARSEPATRAEWQLMIDDALAAQRSMGSSWLTVPTVEIAGGTGLAQLTSSVNGARAAYSQRQQADPRWLLRVCLQDDCILDPRQRANVLNELSNLPDDFGIALHIRWAKRAVGGDQSSLEALRAIIAPLADDGRAVLVLHSGIIGWLATAWGAVGFAAGMNRSSWEDFRGRGGARAKGTTDKEWYFEPSILRWVERSQHELLAKSSSYVPCLCTFCAAIDSGGTWKPSAPQHSLYTLAGLAEETDASSRASRAAKVRSILTQADAAWHAIDAGRLLRTRRQAATHLDLWRTLV